MIRFRAIVLSFSWLSLAGVAHADSDRGPIYIQASPLAVSVYAIECASCVGWSPEIEAGVHFTGRHDGPSIGLRQAFFVGGVNQTSVGAFATLARVGFYDVPIKIGQKMELAISPFGVFGLNHIFDPSLAGVHFGFGADVKFFFVGGFYAYLRPLELGGANYVDAGRVYFHYKTGVGVGVAF